MPLSGWAVFDLDGTLVDTLGEIRLALNRVLARHGRNGLESDVVRDLVGNGPKTLMERAWSKTGSSANAGEAGLLAEEYSKEYDKNPAGMSRPYPGVHEGVQRLINPGGGLEYAPTNMVTPHALWFEIWAGKVGFEL